MTPPAAPLVLIEPYAHRVGGHHQRTLHALAAAHPDTRGITVADIRGSARTLIGCAAAAQVLVAAGRWMFRSRRWPEWVRRLPYQVELVRRCLVEAACLRTVRRDRAATGATVVILTASEGLHAMAAALGGCAHLRFVHEVCTTEDLPLRLLGRLARRGQHRAGLLCPTEAVRQRAGARFPYLPTRVRTYAVDDGHRLTSAEIDSARSIFDIPEEATVVSLVGGWWQHKDIAVIDSALALLRSPLHLLVAGEPVDHAILVRWRHLPQVRLRVEPGSLPEASLRLVYAAANASLVTRRVGVGKESGLVLDAARLGVALIVSDHDPHLTGQLTDHSWCRMFRAGDAAALAVALDRLAGDPPPRPPASAPKALGIPTAAEQAAFLADSAAMLLTRGGHR